LFEVRADARQFVFADTLTQPGPGSTPRASEDHDPETGTEEVKCPLAQCLGASAV
jgi:hypothetical protein